jgi:murein DD-endopeptidase MepM/ murein hydrolase activator NlpD
MTKTVFTLLIATIFMACTEEPIPHLDKPKQEIPAPPPPEPIIEYGMVVDSLIRQDSVVKRNETLADILTAYNVPYPKIVEIASVPVEIFDERYLKPGDKYVLYQANDSAKTPAYFVYEKNAIDYVVFGLKDSMDVRPEKKEVIVKKRFFDGLIQSSLYETFIQDSISPMLALKMANVFAWQIDFFRIQKGDHFKVYYEELYVEDKLVEIGEVKAAYFNHLGEPFYAFEYLIDDIQTYFDEEGNSLEKEFLKAPIKFSRISSGYSNSRFHPILRRYRPHRAIDYAAPRGTPVLAVADGVIIKKQYSRGAGYYLKVRHNSTYTSGYLHLMKYAKGIAPGVKVRQGQTIAYVGSTGLSTGPHLDFRFWKNGSLVNYRKLEFPPAHPIEDIYREDFLTKIEPLKQMLDEHNLPVLATKTTAIK